MPIVDLTCEYMARQLGSFDALSHMDSLLLQSRQSSTGIQKKPWCRHISSKGAALVLMWTILVYGCYYNSIQLSNRVTWLPEFMSSAPGVVSVMIFVLCCPLAGWLADVYFGRYKVMSAGLWLIWVGSIMGVIIQLIELQVPRTSILKYTAMVLVGVLITVGFAAYAANAVAFGTDQMPDASGEQISAFISWFVWARFGGESIALLTSLISSCTSLDKKTALVYRSLLSVLLISLALCCNSLLRSWLTTEPGSRNPLKTICRVLKYAATHKNPVMRSALTYCEDQKPSRIDFGKLRYGGPFTTEEVEDVKSFFWILVVIASSSIILLSSSVNAFTSTTIWSHFKKSSLSQCFDAVIMLSYSQPLAVFLSIPLCEMVIYPILRNHIPSMLKRIVISAVIGVIPSLVLLSIDTAEHVDHTIPCMFVSNDSSTLQIYYLSVHIPITLLDTAWFILFSTALLEFVCAQTPHNMKGLLFGVTNSVSYFNIPLGYGIFEAWKHYWRQPVTHPSCGFWYFLSTALIAGGGVVIICIVAKWYKRRERDEPAYEHMFVEEYYERYSSQDT